MSEGFIYRLVDQVERLSEDRVDRNAKIKLLRDALDEIVDDLSVPTSRPAPWVAHALQVAHSALAATEWREETTP